VQAQVTAWMLVSVSPQALMAAVSMLMMVRGS
jgi:hypothetical protein